MKRQPPWIKKIVALLSQIFFIFLILVGGLVIYHNVYFTPIKIVGNSMEPTLKNQEFGVMDQRGDVSQKVTRFDIVIMQQNPDINRYLIKRLIGLPGEKISFSLSGQLFINDTLLEQTFLDDASYRLSTCLNPAAFGCLPLVLGTDEYFVMGDNRSQSSDSRIWGPLPKELIVGRPIIRMYPPSIFPGEYDFQ